MVWRASGVGDTRGWRCGVVPNPQIKQGRYIVANEAGMEEKWSTKLEWLNAKLLINLKNLSLINPDSISKASKLFGKFQVSLLNGHIFRLHWLKNDESSIRKFSNIFKDRAWMVNVSPSDYWFLLVKEYTLTISANFKVISVDTRKNLNRWRFYPLTY